MNRYEMEIAKLEANTPQFYYPYSVKAKSDYAKEILAGHFRGNGPLRVATKEELNQVDKKMNEFSGKYVFHHNDPTQTEEIRKEQVRNGALNNLSQYDFFPSGPAFENVKKYGAVLSYGEDFVIYVGDRVEVEQPVKLTFEDLPDLMGINEEMKS